MFKNYVRIAWRNLLRSKVFSFINIAGLATGMAVALLVGLWIGDEVSFNSQFTNHKKIAQVRNMQTIGERSGSGDANAIPVGQALRTQFSSDFKRVAYIGWNNDHQLKLDDKLLSAPGTWTQPDFPSMFSLEMVEGNRDVLDDPSTMLISQSLATAIFGKNAALNRIVKVDNKLDMKVGGVYADFPRNTHFYNTKILLPWSNQANWMRDQKDWDNHMCALFVELNQNADLKTVNKKIRNLPTSHISAWKEELFLNPLDQVHLYTEFEKFKPVGGPIEYVRIFGLIGIFVLLLACINFMNLSTARSEKRAREVGIRKTMGSMKWQLVSQFLHESSVFSFLSLLLALVIVWISLPLFNELSGKDMTIPFNNPVFWAIAVGFTLFTGLIAGSYPAFYLSSFNPIKVLKGTFRAGRMASVPRKVLVVLQFTISVALIIGTIIVFRQIEYAKNRPVGFLRNGLIRVPLTPEFDKYFDVARDELIRTGMVENVARSSYAPTNFDQNNSIDWKGKDPNLVVFFRDVNVSPEFGKTIGWTITKGRDFSKDYLTDQGGAVIISEAAAKVIGYKNPIGETIKWQGKDHTIIGIVKDMVTQSPYEQVEPSLFFWEGWNSVVSIRIKPTVATQTAIGSIASIFKKYSPNFTFNYRFILDDYNLKFSGEETIGKLSRIFAILAIFISCLGLFGLTSFIAEQRSKEIGVRKVLGASIFNVWRLLTKEFVVLALISLFIAIPLAYYYMHNWLENYNYRTPISWWVFVIAGAGAIMITILTVSFQAIKAALINPVKTLRSE
jgi:ABC-type antimicrobial peptide transport system permease subunit